MEYLLDGFLPVVEFMVALCNAGTTFHWAENYSRIATHTE